LLRAGERSDRGGKRSLAASVKVTKRTPDELQGVDGTLAPEAARGFEPHLAKPDASAAFHLFSKHGLRGKAYEMPLRAVERGRGQGLAVGG
jgi:hypothetical protein